MALIAVPARQGNWLDVDVPLSDPVLQDVAAAGYEGIYRYVPLPNNPTALDISPGELARICATRRPDGLTLQCGLIQHCRLPANNDLTKHPADRDGQCASDWARTCGYPEGCHLGADFEGLRGPPDELAATNTTPLVIAAATLWQSVVLPLYHAQLYRGYDVPLTDEEAYELSGFDSYWLGLGGGGVAVRGYALTQSGSISIHGISFDRNVMKPDKLGGLPFVAQLA